MPLTSGVRVKTVRWLDMKECNAPPLVPRQSTNHRPKQLCTVWVCPKRRISRIGVRYSPCPVSIGKNKYGHEKIGKTQQQIQQILVTGTLVNGTVTLQARIIDVPKNVPSPNRLRYRQ